MDGYLIKNKEKFNDRIPLSKFDQHEYLQIDIGKNKKWSQTVNLTYYSQLKCEPALSSWLVFLASLQFAIRAVQKTADYCPVYMAELRQFDNILLNVTVRETWTLSNFS